LNSSACLVESLFPTCAHLFLRWHFALPHRAKNQRDLFPGGCHPATKRVVLVGSLRAHSVRCLGYPRGELERISRVPELLDELLGADAGLAGGLLLLMHLAKALL
jgi:hypothetical protein